MESDLASAKNGISERFVPEQDQGRLIEVEHVSRYQWAAQAAKDRLVLDAGCGTAYGSRLLADGGAREVVGVDIARAVLETVAAAMPDSVRLQTGDLRQLDFEDDTFELVVCFEVIEHVEDPFAVLDELVRVLAPGGLLLVSSPNRDVYPPGNPHHLHEFVPAELEAELAARLPHVRLLRQRDYLVSALLSDATSGRGDGAAVEDLALHKLVAERPGDEVYTIAMASDAELPADARAGRHDRHAGAPRVAVGVRDADPRDRRQGRATSTSSGRGSRSEIVWRGCLATPSTARPMVPELNLRIADLEFELEAARSAAAAARQEADQLDRMLMYGRRMLRYVRPFIQPLRRLRRKLRG